MALVLTPARLVIALAACAGPALGTATAHADPQIPTGAICDAVAPIVADPQEAQDDEDGRPDPAQSLVKAQQAQEVLNRIQQNEGLTSGASGAAINAVISAAQTGDLGNVAAAASGLANSLLPQMTDQSGKEDPDADDESGDRGRPPAASPVQGKPLVDPGVLDAARAMVRQDCEQLRADPEPPGSSSDGSSSGDAN
ncbi:hypothetical protein [Segniliparus rugosus]|uniref:Secreted protein n=1 Tax=Segniliparus rugosus (strain ATCC BAA-974 / DSM 45345 / CCUG 50838 / CIP 108380 / JCM 13579 / CDC 945) TaxID=679197 RepID=E5XPH7_SEGRC|nr:hypothetical protein [Segniliparus rugosus]EFV13740.1 hypothetical protein HMPREF9336_01399 [Segniliparus rugosus ATCC BAA-974]